MAGGFNPQFFPTLDSVQALFSRPFTAASFLLHVLAINLIAARSAFVDGECLPRSSTVSCGCLEETGTLRAVLLWWLASSKAC